MPTLAHKLKSDPLKLLNLGESGGGKTGALASLVKAGYELFIMDFDNGTDVLESVLPPELHSKVHVETLTDTGKLSGLGNNAKIIKPNVSAFPKGLGLLQNWIDSETKENFGPVSSWGLDRILVIDSLSFMGSAALDYALARNGRIGEQPWQSDWGEAMRMLEQTLQIIYSTDIKCHVVINSHLDYQQSEGGGVVRGLPQALGTKLSPKVGRYFNMILLTKSRGAGDSTKRVILTKPEGNVEVKCPILEAPKELSVETGLAELFKLWTNKGAATTSKA